MLHYCKCWAAGWWWHLSGMSAANRRMLYNSAYGLRILTFHETPTHHLPRFKRIIDGIRRRYDVVGPEAVDAMLSGDLKTDLTDKYLLTFDDGNASNFQAAKWLSSQGLRATFFIVPSVVDRTIEEFVSYHRSRGVEPYVFSSTNSPQRGLSSDELKEMLDDGHEIAAHNYAHRDLGQLHTAAELDYEIGEAIERVSTLTGLPCDSFAVGFGQLNNVSDEATKMLIERCRKVYMCFRGLNVPNMTSSFLMRHDVRFSQPDIFHRVALRCGADHRVSDRNEEMISRVGVLGRKPCD